MKLRFASKRDEGQDIWSFFFEPVEPLEWIAGQSIRLELPRATWGVEERRFTISSAPFEGHVRITTRMGTSEFKQALDNLKTGDQIQGHNIEGDFVWGEVDKPRLFLAAGIGITPFRSILAQAIHEGKQLNTTLIYSVKEVPPLFQSELDAWQEADPTFYVHYLVGTRLGIEKKSTLAAYWLENIVYVSGPEGMVHEITATLTHKGVPTGNIKTDAFTGYDMPAEGKK